MGIRLRTRPCTGKIGRGPLFIELIWRWSTRPRDHIVLGSALRPAQHTPVRR